jgi:hypothetical protein
MAFTKITDADLQNKGVIGLPDTPGLSTTEMQEKFDEIALDVLAPKHNGLVDELNDSTAAGNMGAINSQGTASTVQAELDNRYPISTVTQLLDNKVDKEEGKALSTNDFSAGYKYKLDNIEDNANNYVLPKGSQSSLGGVMGDGTTFTIDEDGYGHAIGGGGGGTADYNALVNKPVVNGVTVSGNKASEEYGLLRPYLVVTSEAGSTITISKGGETITATQKSGSTTQWEVCPTSYGTWTVSSDLPGADVASTTIVIDAVKTYAITVEHITATITVTYQAGATCVCKKGTTEYVATSNPQTFTVRSIGNWTIETVYDGITKSVSVPISSDGQTESVSIGYATIEVTYGNAFRGTTITCASGATVYSKTAPSGGNTLSFTIASTGTWVVTGEVSGTPYTRTQEVTEMTTYPVTLNVFNATVTVTFPYSNGATCKLSDGVTTLTANTSPMAFNVPNVGTWTATCTIDNVSAPTQSAVITTDGQTETMTFAFGTINLTYDNAFRGLTVTCSSSGTTISKTAPISGNSMSFYPPSTGEWIISSTYSGTPYQTVATITSLSIAVSAQLQMIPDGDTVTPTDDIQKWLNCAGIFDKVSYTALSDILADSITFNALLGDSNANAYLARSTTFATTLCADQYAMCMIGQYDVCCDALLGNSTWASAIVASAYVNSVLNVSVPTMTSATAPSGTVISSGDYSVTYAAWKAFDGNDSTNWASTSPAVANTTNIGYKFANAVKIQCLKIKQNATNYFKKYKVQGSNDGFSSDVHDLTDTVTESSAGNTSVILIPYTTNYSDYRLLCVEPSIANDNVAINTVQFYGHASSTEKIHGANEEVAYYLDGATQVPISNPSTLDAGTYTFGSTVAKNPDSLATDYTKSIRITPNTVEVVLRPDKSLYWWGYESSDFEDVSNANGWSYSAPIVAPTHNANAIRVSASSGQICGVGTKNSVSGNDISVIATGVTASSGNYAFFTQESSKTLAYTDSVGFTSGSLAKLTRTITNGKYYQFGTNNNRACDISAMWYE